jgi:hypothetical protein
MMLIGRFIPEPDVEPIEAVFLEKADDLQGFPVPACHFDQ